MIPLDIFLKFACCYSGQCSVSSYPELLICLMSHPERGKSFYLEKTSAAKGPWVLYTPEGWKQEQEYNREINRLITEQYKPKADPMDALIKKMEAARKLQDQIKDAESQGLTQIAESLKTVLKNL